jgi:glucan phosphoethanolaminetransferase (alkaline phosphatase superfamily)
MSVCVGMFNTDGNKQSGMGLISAFMILGYVVVIIILLWFLGLGRSPTDIQLRSLRVQGTAIAVIVILGIVLAAFLALQTSIP